MMAGNAKRKRSRAARRLQLWKRSALLASSGHLALNPPPSGSTTFRPKLPSRRFRRHLQTLHLKVRLRNPRRRIRPRRRNHKEPRIQQRRLTEPTLDPAAQTILHLEKVGNVILIGRGTNIITAAVLQEEYRRPAALSFGYQHRSNVVRGSRQPNWRVRAGTIRWVQGAAQKVARLS